MSSKILNSVIENLTDSTDSGWYSAGFDEWSDWAKKMRTTIETSTPIMESISQNISEIELENKSLKEAIIEKDKIIASLISKIH